MKELLILKHPKLIKSHIANSGTIYLTTRRGQVRISDHPRKNHQRRVAKELWIWDKQLIQKVISFLNGGHR